MRSKLIRTGLQVLAAIFIVFGLLGLFLPFLQGILFIIIGITLLSFSSPSFKAWLDKRLWRFPKVRSRLDRMHGRMEKWFY